MTTKPKGIHATFQTECVYCRGDLTASDGIERLKAAFDATYNNR